MMNALLKLNDPYLGLGETNPSARSDRPSEIWIKLLHANSSVKSLKEAGLWPSATLVPSILKTCLCPINEEG